MNIAKETGQWALLWNGDYNVKELPISVYALCQRIGVGVKVFVPKDANDGLSLVVDGEPFILVGTTSSVERQRFTAAHELGHILLGHAGTWARQRDDGTVHFVQGRKCADRENEANVFASELLMPECVLMSCGVETAEEIALLCKTLPEDAEPVAERIRQRRQKGESFTPMEQRIVQRFLEYIQRTCKVTCRQEGRE